MIQNLQVNSLNQRPISFGIVNVQNSGTLKLKNSLNVDTVSFTSLALLKRKPIFDKLINIVTGRPTTTEMAKEILKIASQIAAVVSSAVALVVLAL